MRHGHDISAVMLPHRSGAVKLVSYPVSREGAIGCRAIIARGESGQQDWGDVHWRHTS